MSHEQSTAARTPIEAWVAKQTPPPGLAERTWSAIETRAARGDLGPELSSGVASKAGAGFTLRVLLASVLGIGGGAASIVAASSSDSDPSDEVASEVPAANEAPPPPSPAPAPAQAVPLVEPPAVEPELEPSEPVPTIELEKSRKPRPATRTVEPPAETDTLAAEMALLAAARKALKRGDTDEALEQLADHAERFPRGALASEREQSRVTALCQADRASEAIEIARAWAKKHPSSPLAKRADAPCGP